MKTANEVVYGNKTCRGTADESVLDVLLRHGVDIPFSCRAGICKICLMKAKVGTVDELAIKDLPHALVDKGFFLPCQQSCKSDYQLEMPRESDVFTRATIYAREQLNEDICRVRLRTPVPVYYHPGQFINLRRYDGHTRSYSLASLPTEDDFLEIHVRAIPDGVMSQWVMNELQPGMTVDIQGPLGDCYYRSEMSGRNLLLIGTGTGLAPLAGICRDAIHNRHRGEIYLYHGTHSPKGLYLDTYLKQLDEENDHFHYIPCVSGDEYSNEKRCRADDVAFAEHRDLGMWSVYICGNPAMVGRAAEQALLAGCEPGELYTDPYEYGDRHLSAVTVSQPGVDPRAEPDWPEPQPELWEALDNGVLLEAVLKDFYSVVFRDPLLSPFFEGVTQERVRAKQFSFVKRILTGEKCYFGERPRNSHHWMVISDELFDYRENLFSTMCRLHALPEPVVQGIRSLHEQFRQYIVKQTPWPRLVGDIEVPLDGLEEMVMEMSTLCDHCGAEIAVGDTVKYHVRLGKVYCRQCTPA